jgi:hypothetical protein
LIHQIITKIKTQSIIFFFKRDKRFAIFINALFGCIELALELRNLELGLKFPCLDVPRIRAWKRSSNSTRPTRASEPSVPSFRALDLGNSLNSRSGSRALLPDRSHRATERLPSRRRQVPPPSSLRLPPPAVFFFGASPSLLHPFPLAAPPYHDPTLTLELRVGRWFNGGGRWFNSGGRWANDGTRGARCPLPWTSQKFCPPQDRHRHGRRATTASEAELGSSL